MKIRKIIGDPESYSVSKLFASCNYNTHKDLVGLDFSEMDLVDEKFIDCDLSGVSFRNSDLSGVEFVNCKIRGSDFSEAFGVNTTFDVDDGEIPNLTGAHFIEPNFRTMELEKRFRDRCEVLQSFELSQSPAVTEGNVAIIIRDPSILDYFKRTFSSSDKIRNYYWYKNDSGFHELIPSTKHGAFGPSDTDNQYSNTNIILFDSFPDFLVFSEKINTSFEYIINISSTYNEVISPVHHSLMLMYSRNFVEIIFNRSILKNIVKSLWTNKPLQYFCHHVYSGFFDLEICISNLITRLLKDIINDPSIDFELMNFPRHIFGEDLSDNINRSTRKYRFPVKNNKVLLLKCTSLQVPNDLLIDNQIYRPDLNCAYLMKRSDGQYTYPLAHYISFSDSNDIYQSYKSNSIPSTTLEFIPLIDCSDSVSDGHLYHIEQANRFAFIVNRYRLFRKMAQIKIQYKLFERHNA